MFIVLKKNTEDKNNKNKKNQTIKFEKYLNNVQIQFNFFFSNFYCKK